MATPWCANSAPMFTMLSQHQSGWLKLTYRNTARCIIWWHPKLTGWWWWLGCDDDTDDDDDDDAFAEAMLLRASSGSSKLFRTVRRIFYSLSLRATYVHCCLAASTSHTLTMRSTISTQLCIQHRHSARLISAVQHIANGCCRLANDCETYQL